MLNIALKQVNIKNASYTNSIGDTRLSAVWTDADFYPSQHAVLRTDDRDLHAVEKGPAANGTYLSKYSRHCERAISHNGISNFEIATLLRSS